MHSSDADDDYDEPAKTGNTAQQRRAETERAEHAKAADVAVSNGAPAQRPRRAAAAAANEAMDDMDRRGELV